MRHKILFIALFGFISLALAGQGLAADKGKRKAKPAKAAHEIESMKTLEMSPSKTQDPEGPEAAAAENTVRHDEKSFRNLAGNQLSVNVRSSISIALHSRCAIDVRYTVQTPEFELRKCINPVVEEFTEEEKAKLLNIFYQGTAVLEVVDFDTKHLVRYAPLGYTRKFAIGMHDVTTNILGFQPKDLRDILQQAWDEKLAAETAKKEAAGETMPDNVKRMFFIMTSLRPFEVEAGSEPGTE